MWERIYGRLHLSIHRTKSQDSGKANGGGEGERERSTIEAAADFTVKYDFSIEFIKSITRIFFPVALLSMFVLVVLGTVLH
jgi:hypothetical protein